MSREARRYAGPRVVAWPMRKSSLGIGCAAAIWLALVVGLELVVFSLVLSKRVVAVLNDHFGTTWLALAAPPS